MALFDLPVEQLWRYRPDRDEPADFDAFWAQTLAEARQFPLDPVLRPEPGPFTLVEVCEIEFAGFGGHRIGGWFLRPRHHPDPVPCVVRYLGYTAGRGHPHQWLAAPACGIATLVMDTRGQGGGSGEPGRTADPVGGTGAEAPGFLTRGLAGPQSYYSRRGEVDDVFTVCPPSTVFAAHNHYAGERHMRVWPYNGHEGGGEQEAENLALLASILRQ